MQQTNVREILRMMFLNDWPWKILSLIIACMVYFSVRDQISNLRVVSVPVDVVFDAASTDVVIESVEPGTVQVTLRGSRSDLDRLNPANMQFSLKPKRKKSSAPQDETETLRLESSLLRNARNVRVVKIEPTEDVLVRFDVPMELLLPIAKPTLTGNARGQVTLSYDTTNAVVTGSRRLIATLVLSKEHVQTAPIDIEGRTQSFQTRVALTPPGDPIRLNVTPAEITVNVHISHPSDHDPE